MIPRDKWQYKGLAGHHICASRCLFRLCTLVGDYKISTVGAMWNEGEMEQVGSGRHYETFVFEKDSYLEIDSSSVYFDKDKDDPFETDKIAERNHDEMCLKYAKKHQEEHQ